MLVIFAKSFRGIKIHSGRLIDTKTTLIPPLRAALGSLRVRILSARLSKELYGQTISMDGGQNAANFNIIGRDTGAACLPFSCKEATENSA